LAYWIFCLINTVWRNNTYGTGEAMIDIDKLRKDMLNDCYGAFFVADFGGALVYGQEKPQ